VAGSTSIIAGQTTSIKEKIEQTRFYRYQLPAFSAADILLSLLGAGLPSLPDIRLPVIRQRVDPNKALCATAPE
jgi:hypothetical protein